MLPESGSLGYAQAPVFPVKLNPNLKTTAPTQRISKRTLLSPEDTRPCLGTSGVVTLVVLLAASGWGRGCGSRTVSRGMALSTGGCI